MQAKRLKKNKAIDGMRVRITREIAAFTAILSEKRITAVVDFVKKKTVSWESSGTRNAGPFVSFCVRASFLAVVFFFFLKGGLEDAQARDTRNKTTWIASRQKERYLGEATWHSGEEVVMTNGGIG
jgi:hypothetical protein